MSLVVFTALVGLSIAPGQLDPLEGFIALLCIAAGAGAAGVLNMGYDADVDALMARTAMRPIPRGRISRAEALAFGLMLGTGAIRNTWGAAAALDKLCAVPRKGFEPPTHALRMRCSTS